MRVPSYAARQSLQILMQRWRAWEKNEARQEILPWMLESLVAVSKRMVHSSLGERVSGMLPPIHVELSMATNEISRSWVTDFHQSVWFVMRKRLRNFNKRLGFCSRLLFRISIVKTLFCQSSVCYLCETWCEWKALQLQYMTTDSRQILLLSRLHHGSLTIGCSRGQVLWSTIPTWWD